MAYVQKRTWLEYGPGPVARPRRKRGMGAVTVIPPSLTVPITQVQAACSTAGGTWLPNNAGCQLDLGASYPSYCDWVPFATSMFSECKLPASPSDLTPYGAYTVYQIALQSGQNAGAAASAQNLQNAQDTFQQNQPELNDCDYQAASSYPSLSQIFGPSLTRMLTNPANSGCTPAASSLPGWVLWLGIGIAAVAVVPRLIR